MNWGTTNSNDRPRPESWMTSLAMARWEAVGCAGAAGAAGAGAAGAACWARAGAADRARTRQAVAKRFIGCSFGNGRFQHGTVDAA